MEWTSVQLRSLVELRRRGTLTAVAELLGYTTGGVSQQISALERAVGAPLVRRAGRRLELTDAGAALARHAERILLIEAEAVAALESVSPEVAGELVVGLFATAAADILPVLLGRLAGLFPELLVRSRDMDVDDVYDAVASGAVDLAIGLDYPDVPIPRDPLLEVRLLYRETFALALPAGHAAGHDRKRISLSETAGMSWILPRAGTHYERAIRTVCRRAGLEPNPAHEVTDTAATMALVEAGVGVSTVTDLMCRLRPSTVDVLALVEEFTRDIVAITRVAAPDRPAVAAVLAVLTDLGPRRD